MIELLGYISLGGRLILQSSFDVKKVALLVTAV